MLLLALMLPSQAAVPAFSGKDMNGDTHALSDYHGKMVVVNFWATWCPPCLEEMPELAIFHDNYKDTKAVVLGVNYEDISRAKLESFIDEQMVDFPVLPMKPGKKTPFGRLVGLPTTYIVSPDQTRVKVHVGPLTMKHLDAYLESFGN